MGQLDRRSSRQLPEALRTLPPEDQDYVRNAGLHPRAITKAVQETGLLMERVVALLEVRRALGEHMGGRGVPLIGLARFAARFPDFDIEDDDGLEPVLELHRFRLRPRWRGHVPKGHLSVTLFWLIKEADRRGVDTFEELAREILEEPDDPSDDPANSSFD